MRWGLNVKLIRPTIKVEIKKNKIASSTNDGHSENLPVVKTFILFHFFGEETRHGRGTWGQIAECDKGVQTHQEQTGKQTHPKQPETPTSGVFEIVHFILSRVHTPQAWSLSRLQQSNFNQLFRLFFARLFVSALLSLCVCTSVGVCNYSDMQGDSPKSPER